jgi:hypothetical protein
MYRLSSSFLTAIKHGTSLMGKYMLAKAHSAKLNELTESAVTELTRSTVNETLLAIFKRKGSRGITGGISKGTGQPCSDPVCGMWFRLEGSKSGPTPDRVCFRSFVTWSGQEPTVCWPC